MSQLMTDSLIPYGRQWIDDDDVASIVQCLRGDWLTQGPYVFEFEKNLAEYCGAKYAVSFINATAGLHAACAALELGPGDEGITSSNTFLASSNSMIYCGARPVFADIDAHTYNISPEQIRTNLSSKTKVVIPVHFAGQPCEMEAIKNLADQHGFSIIEDAAHAIGAEYKGTKIGSCRFSDMTVFSFHPVKQMTTAEGGAVLTNREDLYEKLIKFRSHGIVRDSEKWVNEGHLGQRWYYEMQDLGFNFRLPDLNCALGISQLKKLDAFIAKRRSIVARYNEAFSELSWLKTPKELTDRKSSYHLYAVRMNFNELGKTRQEVMSRLLEAGIGTQVHYIPVHTQPYYREFVLKGQAVSHLVNTNMYYQETLSLPLYPKMNDSEIDRVIESVRALKG